MASYISLAHFNPVISFGYALISEIDARTFGLYALTQTLTAIVMACVGGWLYGLPETPTTDLKLATGILAFSFALCLVHLTVLAQQPGNGFFGISVGFTMFAGI